MFFCRRYIRLGRNLGLWESSHCNTGRWAGASNFKRFKRQTEMFFVFSYFFPLFCSCFVSKSVLSPFASHTHFLHVRCTGTMYMYYTSCILHPYTLMPYIYSNCTYYYMNRDICYGYNILRKKVTTRNLIIITYLFANTYINITYFCVLYCAVPKVNQTS
jgi:hypothetical protein